MATVFHFALNFPFVHFVVSHVARYATTKNMGINAYTLPKTNIAPVRRPSQRETHLPTPSVSGAMLVSGRVIASKPSKRTFRSCQKFHAIWERSRYCKYRSPGGGVKTARSDPNTTWKTVPSPPTYLGYNP